MLGTNRHTEIYTATGPPTFTLLATHHLALDSHGSSLQSNQPDLLPHLFGFRNPLHATTGKSRLLVSTRGRHRLWPCHFSRLLARQLSRDVCPRPRMRKCSHDCGPAMGGTVADFLGHHQRGNVLLQSRPRTGILWMGLCMAATPDCGGESTVDFRPALTHRTECRDLVRLVRHQHRAVSTVLLLYAVEDGEGEETGRER